MQETASKIEIVFFIFFRHFVKLEYNKLFGKFSEILKAVL